MSTPLLMVTDRPHVDDVKPKIVVPLASAALDPFVARAARLNLRMQGLEARFVDVSDSLDADLAYDRLFREVWAEGEPFVLVEHDVLPWPGAVQEIWMCDEPWCGFQYLVFGELRSYLGCVKMDPSVLGDVPLPPEASHWSTLDRTIIAELSRRGFPGHLHRPAVVHLNYGHQRMTSTMVLADLRT